MNEHEQLVDRAARHARTVLFLGGHRRGQVDPRARDRGVRAAGRPHGRLPRRRRGAEDRRAAGHRRDEAHPRRRRPHARRDGRGRRARVRGVDLAAGSPGAARRRAPAAARARPVRGRRPRRRRHRRRDRRDPRPARSTTTRSTCSSPTSSWGCTRGEELEPILGIVDRFFGVETATAPVHPDVAADERRGPDDPADEDDGPLLRTARPCNGSGCVRRCSCRRCRRCST